MISGFESDSKKQMGEYIQLDGVFTGESSRPVYKNENDEYLFYGDDKWRVGSSYSEPIPNGGSVRHDGGINSCPNELSRSQWQYYSESSWKRGENLDVVCMCNIDCF